jgi:Holliday junction resolvase RusA-like endonuclease
LRGDLDNYIKLCLDGCQRAGIIPNDRLVVQLKAVKE